MTGEKTQITRAYFETYVCRTHLFPKKDKNRKSNLLDQKPCYWKSSEKNRRDSRHNYYIDKVLIMQINMKVKRE